MDTESKMTQEQTAVRVGVYFSLPPGLTREERLTMLDVLWVDWPEELKEKMANFGGALIKQTDEEAAARAKASAPSPAK